MDKKRKVYYIVLDIIVNDVPKAYCNFYYKLIYSKIKPSNNKKLRTCKI